MCYGFVGKTFNLRPGVKGTGILKHKRHENKQFNRQALPQFRQRQLELGLEGRGQFARNGLEIDVKKTLRASTNSGRRSLSPSSSNGNLLMSAKNNSRRTLNPQLTMNRPEVRQALSEARRTLRLSEGKGTRKR